MASRLRMIAGPNGSGKSTIKDTVAASIPGLLGVYINPDEIEKTIKASGTLDLAAFQVTTGCGQLQAFFSASSLVKKHAALLTQWRHIRVEGSSLIFAGIEANSYWASVVADFIRHRLLETGISFTFETVMSSPDKVAFLNQARQCGFRTYLYFIATEDPAINLSRIAYRVQAGGHAVPQEKVLQRYWRSLDLVPKAIAASNRAYLFDNSGAAPVWIAEVTDGEMLEMKVSQLPHWFEVAVWDKWGLES